MRQAKLSELIHNSDQYPDLDNCSVEVHFREIIDLVCLDCGSFRGVSNDQSSPAQMLWSLSQAQSSWWPVKPSRTTRADIQSTVIQVAILKFRLS